MTTNQRKVNATLRIDEATQTLSLVVPITKAQQDLFFVNHNDTLTLDVTFEVTE